MANDRSRVPAYATERSDRLIGSTVVVNPATIGSPLTNQANYSASKYPTANLFTPRPGQLWAGVPHVDSPFAFFDIRIQLDGPLGTTPTNEVCAWLVNTNAAGAVILYNTSVSAPGAPNVTELGFGPAPASPDNTWVRFADPFSLPSAGTERYQSHLHRHPTLGSSLQNARWIWIRFAVSAAVPAISLGRLWLGSMTPIRLGEGMQTRPEGESESHSYDGPEHRSMFGQTWRTRGPHLQTVDISFPSMLQGNFEALENLWHSVRGGTQYVLFARDMFAVEQSEKRAAYGRLSDWRYSAGFSTPLDTQGRVGSTSFELTCDPPVRVYI